MSKMDHDTSPHFMSRRRPLGTAGLGGLALLSAPALAKTIDLPLPGGPDAPPLTTAFAQKGS